MTEDSSIIIRDATSANIRVRTELGDDGIHTPQHVIRESVLAPGAATESTLVALLAAITTNAELAVQVDRIITQLITADGGSGATQESTAVSSDSVETNIISTPSPGNKAVITSMQISNASSQAVRIDFKQGATSAVKKSFFLAPNGGGIIWEGRWEVPRDDPIKAILSTSAPSVLVNSDYHIESA